MTFFTECFISAAFFGSSVYMMTVNNDIKDELYNSLSEEAQLHYKKIVKERVSIYIKATIAAIVLAILVNTFYLSKNNSCINNTCISTAVYFFTQYIVYSLHPKSDWVLNHLENKEQTQLWLKKYKYMKNKWHVGLILGIVGYFLATYFISQRVDSDLMDIYNQDPFPEGPPADMIQQAAPPSPLALGRN